MTEPHVVRIAARAERDLDRLPEKIATACLEFIFGALAAQPRRVGKPLRAELTGLWSARRGDYRVIYRIVDDAGDAGASDHAVEIVHIARRSDVYRR